MLSKREELPTNQPQSTFAAEHAHKLIDPAGQDLVFRDKTRERELVTMWGTLLDAYFAEVITCSINHLCKVFLFLELNGIQTHSLKRLLTEGKLGGVALLTHAEDFNGLRKVIIGQVAQGRLSKLIGWFKRRNHPNDNYLLVHVASLRNSYARFSKTTIDLITKQELIKEGDVIATSAKPISDFERHLFLAFMCTSKLISASKISKEVIYSRYYSDLKSISLQKALYKYAVRETLSCLRDQVQKLEGDAMEAPQPDLLLSRSQFPRPAEDQRVDQKKVKNLWDSVLVLEDIQKVIGVLVSQEEIDSVASVFEHIQKLTEILNTGDPHGDSSKKSNEFCEAEFRRQ